MGVTRRGEGHAVWLSKDPLTGQGIRPLTHSMIRSA